MKKYIRLIISFALLCICCLYVSLTVSAVSYITGRDKGNLEKLLEETNVLDGTNAMHIIGIDKSEFPIVNFYNKSEAQNLGYVQEGYLPPDYFVMKLNKGIMDNMTSDARRILLDNLRNSFQNNAMAEDISSEAKHLFYNELRTAYGDDVEYIQKEVVNELQPNMFLAYETYQPFKSFVGTILGCIVSIIIISMVFSITLDFMYMQVPTFRESVYEHSQKRGGGRFSLIRNRTQLNRPWFISYEAAYATKMNMESNGEINVMLLYLKTRAVSFIVVAVCLAYLTMGFFMDIINWVWKTAPYIIDPTLW